MKRRYRITLEIQTEDGATARAQQQAFKAYAGNMSESIGVRVTTSSTTPGLPDFMAEPVVLMERVME